MPTSPDVPALVNYALVVCVGSLVAASTVNTLLHDQADRWAFGATWLLAAAHVAIPPALFWFLDYTEAIHDTSLFAALVVGIGYRQVFAGGIEGIRLAGQTPLLWKPFEAWVQSVIQRIAVKNKQYRDRFEEASKTRIASNAGLLSKLQQLAEERTTNPGGLSANVTGVASGPSHQRALTTLLWEDLRRSEPLIYGQLLVAAGIVPWRSNWWWLQKGRAKAVTVSVLVGAIFLANWTYPIMKSSQDGWLLGYYQWRVRKQHATELDHYRATRYIREVLALVGSSDGESTGSSTHRLRVLRPLLDQLERPSTTEASASRIVALVLSDDNAIRSEGVLRVVIAALRTENLVVRGLVDRMLRRIREVAYPKSRVSKEVDPPPQSGETFEAVDRRVRAWMAWMVSRGATQADSPAEQQLENPGDRYVPDIVFAFNRADLLPSAEKPLAELVALLSRNPSWRIRVEAHTDGIGSESSNLALSQRRLDTVVGVLVQRGVAAQRIEGRALGERFPRDDNGTPEGQARNRRVEFVRLASDASSVTAVR